MGSINKTFISTFTQILYQIVIAAKNQKDHYENEISVMNILVYYLNIELNLMRCVYFDLLNPVGIIDVFFTFLSTGSSRGIAKLLFHRVNLWLFTYNHEVVTYLK